MTIENCSLSKAKLHQFGKQLTKLRLDLRTYAGRFLIGEGNMDDIEIFKYDNGNSFCNDEIVERVNSFSAKM